MCACELSSCAYLPCYARPTPVQRQQQRRVSLLLSADGTDDAGNGHESETDLLYGERKGINNWNGTGQTLATLFLSVALLAPYPAAWIGQALLSRFEGWFRSDKTVVTI